MYIINEQTVLLKKENRIYEKFILIFVIVNC